jgi:hypothetical protein
LFFKPVDLKVEMRSTLLFSVPFFFMSCEKNNQTSVPHLDTNAYSEKKHDEVERLALKGDAAAQYNLGDRYYFG